VSAADDGISRRGLLLGGLAAFLAGVITADSGPDQGMLPGGGQPTVSGSFGDWEAVVTAAWEDVEIDSEPTLVYHLDDGLVVWALEDADLPAQTTVETLTEPMNVAIATDVADVTIETFPTLVLQLDSDGSLGTQYLYTEGDN